LGEGRRDAVGTARPLSKYMLVLEGIELGQPLDRLPIVNRQGVFDGLEKFFKNLEIILIGDLNSLSVQLQGDTF